MSGIKYIVEIDDQASPYLAQIGRELNAPEIKRVMGRAIVPIVQSHFEGLEGKSNNPLGKSDYWIKAARSVQQPNIQNDGFSIGIGRVGVALHLFGGTVRPGKNISRHTGGPTQYLTIPARSEAYGHRADEFPNLKVQFGRGGRPVALVERDDLPATETQVHVSKSGIKRRVKVQKPLERTGGIVMFWLVRQVTIRPNPDVLPTTPEMAQPAFKSAATYLQKLRHRANG